MCVSLDQASLISFHSLRSFPSALCAKTLMKPLTKTELLTYFLPILHLPFWNTRIWILDTIILLLQLMTFQKQYKVEGSWKTGEGNKGYIQVFSTLLSITISCEGVMAPFSVLWVLLISLSVRVSISSSHDKYPRPPFPQRHTPSGLESKFSNSSSSKQCFFYLWVSICTT